MRGPQDIHRKVPRAKSLQDTIMKKMTMRRVRQVFYTCLIPCDHWLCSSHSFPEPPLSTHGFRLWACILSVVNISSEGHLSISSGNLSVFTIELFRSEREGKCDEHFSHSVLCICVELITLLICYGHCVGNCNRRQNREGG